MGIFSSPKRQHAQAKHRAKVIKSGGKLTGRQAEQAAREAGESPFQQAKKAAKKAGRL